MPEPVTPRARASAMSGWRPASPLNRRRSSNRLPPCSASGSVTDFVLTSVQAAQRAIQEHQSLDLSVRDSQAFVEARQSALGQRDRLRENCTPLSPGHRRLTRG